MREKNHAYVRGKGEISGAHRLAPSWVQQHRQRVVIESGQLRDLDEGLFLRRLDELVAVATPFITGSTS